MDDPTYILRNHLLPEAARADGEAIKRLIGVLSKVERETLKQKPDLEKIYRLASEGLCGEWDG